jgi:hypothetical protein
MALAGCPVPAANAPAIADDAAHRPTTNRTSGAFSVAPSGAARSAVRSKDLARELVATNKAVGVHRISLHAALRALAGTTSDESRTL